RGTELVMRKDQVGAAALDVEAHAEIPQRDGRTFDMPGRPPASKRRLPDRVPRALRVPEQTVDRILLSRPIRVTAALSGQCDHLVAGEAPDGSESRVRACREVKIAVNLVRRPPPPQPLYQGDDVLHRFDGTD